MKDQVTKHPKTSQRALLHHSNAIEGIPHLLGESIEGVPLPASCGTQGTPVISLVASCRGDDIMAQTVVRSRKDQDELP